MTLSAAKVGRSRQARPILLRIVGGHRKIADAVAMPHAADIEFEAPRAAIALVHGFTVVTGDVADLGPTGAPS